VGGRHMGTDKDTEKLVRIARKQDWRVELTRGNHLLFVSPSGERILGGLTSSGGGQRRLRYALIKAGLVV
jgi:hypothetical protein